MVRHYVAIGAVYDDLGRRMSWDVSDCDCDQPWVHGGGYLGTHTTPPTATPDPAGTSEQEKADG